MAKILDPIHPEEILREEFLAPLGIGRPARETVVPPGESARPSTPSGASARRPPCGLRVFSAFPRKCGSGSRPSTTCAWRAVSPARKSNGVFILTPRLESLPPTVVRQRPLRHPLQRTRHSGESRNPEESLAAAGFSLPRECRGIGRRRPAFPVSFCLSASFKRTPISRSCTSSSTSTPSLPTDRATPPVHRLWRR